jgi:hypothetical protein
VPEHPEVKAVILFGSVARHEERSLADDAPSDVDMMILVDADPAGNPLPVDRAIYETVGRMRHVCGNTAREVQVTVAETDITYWEETFAESVAHDALLLWLRSETP